MSAPTDARDPLQEIDPDVETEITENDEDFQDIDRPWDPESIRVSTKNFSLRNILDLIDEHSLEIAPDFQRLQVWKVQQQAQLIESILLQIPLPAFYFAEDPDGSLRVVDGLQRISTVYKFVRGGEDRAGGFHLRNLEYIADLHGKRFSDLPTQWQRRIYNTQIVAHVIDPSTPAPVKYDIFRRINTGGTPLNSQEIRHCMSGPRSRSFLKNCAESPEFQSATDGALNAQKRMIDREVVLRFVSFTLLEDTDQYRDYGSMERLLWSTTEKLDNTRDVPESTLRDLQTQLDRGLENSRIVFGDNAFRKWPLESQKRYPFNRALFETWTYTLSRYPQKVVSTHADDIQQYARQLMTDDVDYINSITVSTGDIRRVEKRFNSA